MRKVFEGNPEINLARYINSDKNCITYPYENISLEKTFQAPKYELDYYKITRQMIEHRNLWKEAQKQVFQLQNQNNDLKNELEEQRQIVKKMLYQYFPHIYDQEVTNFNDNILKLKQGINEQVMQIEIGCKPEELLKVTQQQRDKYLTFKERLQQNNILSSQNQILQKQIADLSQEKITLDEKIRKLQNENFSLMNINYIQQTKLQSQGTMVNQYQQQQWLQAIQNGEVKDFLVQFLDFCYSLKIDTTQTLIQCLRDLQQIYKRQLQQLTQRNAMYTSKQFKESSNQNISSHLQVSKNNTPQRNSRIYDNTDDSFDEWMNQQLNI